MSEKKELSNEELEKVTGGSDDWGEEHAAYLPAGHGIHVAATEAYKVVGQDVYIVDDGYPNLFIWGTLTSSNSINHSVTVKGKSSDRFDAKFEVTSVDIGKNCTFTKSLNTLYLYN